MLTKEEEILLKKLSQSPKCMHNPTHMIEKENHWQCGECGLIAKKRLPEMPYRGLEIKDGKVTGLK